MVRQRVQRAHPGSFPVNQALRVLTVFQECTLGRVPLCVDHAELANMRLREEGAVWGVSEDNIVVPQGQLHAYCVL